MPSFWSLMPILKASAAAGADNAALRARARMRRVKGRELMSLWRHRCHRPLRRRT
jgi:hypothetical protein